MADLTESANSGRIELSKLNSSVRLGSVSPGNVSRLDFMEPRGVLAIALAKLAGVFTDRVSAILHVRRAITAETALLLADAVGATAEFWINLRTAHNVVLARA